MERSIKTQLHRRSFSRRRKVLPDSSREGKTNLTFSGMNMNLEMNEDEEAGEIFLVSLTKEQLQSTGFDISKFGQFRYADIYLYWIEIDFQLKFVLDGDSRRTHYIRVGEVDDETYNLIIKEYSKSD